MNYNSSIMTLDSLDIERNLSAIGEILKFQGEVVGIVILGGAAINLLGLIQRTTNDIDVLALVDDNQSESIVSLISPNPFPECLANAIRRVTRDFNLPDGWINTEVSMQLSHGLPPGFERRLIWKQYGGLKVGIPSRYDHVVFKLWASADHDKKSRHFRDLVELNPTQEELQSAVEWLTGQDTSQEFEEIVHQVIAEIHKDDR